MPSLKDPSDALLPQNPLHPAFFPEARALQAFRSVTNPYHCKVGGCEILGSSGEGVEDMQAFSELSPLDALVTSVRGRVLAPTAPDTLRCAPSVDNDPCVIGPSSPHIVFAGNTPAAEWTVIDSGTLCLCVPAFTKTPRASW
jgi:DNA polymerase delta subunit 2